LKRLALLLTLASAACTTGGSRDADGGPSLKPAADSSAVIAAESAFNRLAQEKGQWTAFRETMAPGAEMFVPHRVLASEWLKGRADPPIPVKWQPQAVWSSCDGSIAVTRGEWQRPGSTGNFVTVWQRQQKGGGYKWVLDLSVATERPVTPTDSVAARVAVCKGVDGPVPMQPLPSGSDAVQATSADRTLQWTSWDGEAGTRQIAIYAWNGTRFDEVLRASVPLPTR
jgi:hypothetical protein